MITKPNCGWSYFQLENTSLFGLSYLNDIAFEWIDEAIHGLEKLTPFCVEGFMEPNRFICVVSYWNCHIICEEDGREPLDKNDILHEYSHISMIDFCKNLYNDLLQNVDEWVSFMDYLDVDEEARKELLLQKLARLKELIIENEEAFGKNGYFFF